jgi:hypothetical protein
VVGTDDPPEVEEHPGKIGWVRMRRCVTSV